MGTAEGQNGAQNGPLLKNSATSSRDSVDAKTSAQIDSWSQLFRAIYSGKFKRRTLKKAEIAALRKCSVPSENDYEALLSLAKSDVLLEKTRQLLLLGARLDISPFPAPIVEITRRTLAEHPIFHMDSLSDVLANLPDAISAEQAFAKVAKTDCSKLSLPGTEKPLTKKQCTRSATNAVHCLAILLWASRGMTVDRIQAALYSHLWQKGVKKRTSDAQKLQSLIEDRASSAAAATFEILESKAAEQGLRAESATRAKERAEERLAQLERSLAKTGEQLAAEQAERRRIRQELEVAVKAHATAESHWQDDYQNLRGQMLHRLKQELALLDEGLHALRRDPPKIHVMIDHAERAIDGLKREMERLRGEG